MKEGGTGGRTEGASARSAARVPEGSTAPFGGLDVAFVGSFPDADVRLEPPLPEIAFVGRSNVGKSSLLNALTGREGLARVSATPGKTTLVNVFRLPTFHLIDLPGYGFAKASKTARDTYRHLLGGFLTTRESLTGVVWLLDCRHDPSKDDADFQELLEASGRSVLAVLTKADKLSRAQQRERVRAVSRATGLPEDQLLLVSSKDGLGISELGASVLAAVGS